MVLLRRSLVGDLGKTLASLELVITVPLPPDQLEALEEVLIDHNITYRLTTLWLLKITLSQYYGVLGQRDQLIQVNNSDLDALWMYQLPGNQLWKHLN